MSDDSQTDRRGLTDPLTMLMSRQAWDRNVPPVLEAADAARVPVCLLVLDLDDFAGINARGGEDEGNRVLKEVAALWRSHVRQNDVVARVGPDEFAMLLVACSLEAATAVARRLCSLLDADRVSVSVGGSEWNGSETADELLTRAEATLQQARHFFPDRIEVAAEASSKS